MKCGISQRRIKKCQSTKLKGGNQPHWQVAISRIKKWQSAALKGGNQPNWKVAISRIQRWQSAELKGGNQPNSKGFAEDTAKMHSTDFKHYHGLKIGPGHTDKSQILMKCNKPTNERQKECKKQKHKINFGNHRRNGSKSRPLSGPWRNLQYLIVLDP